MKTFDTNEHSNRRFNLLQENNFLVSTYRSKRPWQGQKETLDSNILPEHDSLCYLCFGNLRSNEERNPNYTDSFVFENDFPALLQEIISDDTTEKSAVFRVKPERGINKAVNFSPKYNVTIPEMDVASIEKVIAIWKEQYIELGSKYFINYV